MRRLVVVTVLMILALGSATPARASSVTVSRFYEASLVADALFDGFDASGCVETSTDVFAIDGRIALGGSINRVREVDLFIDAYDTCSGTDVFVASGQAALGPGAFHIDTRLTSASLHATITADDVINGGTVPITISAEWTGIGDVRRAVETTHTVQPGFVLIERINGLFRTATLTASISDGTTEFAGGDPVSAGLRNVKSGEVSVVH